MEKVYNFLLAKYKLIIGALLLIFIMTLIVFVTLIISKGDTETQPTSNDILSPNPTSFAIIPDIVKTETELSIGKKIPGTIENIQLSVHKITKEDSLALVRLRIEGGEILEVNSQYLNLGACVNNQKFFNDRICVDIGKPEPFEEGEVIANVKIKWGGNIPLHIYRGTEDGMYNGSEFNASDQF